MIDMLGLMIITVIVYGVIGLFLLIDNKIKDPLVIALWPIMIIHWICAQLVVAVVNVCNLVYRIVVRILKRY
jgi:hypothetical protein